MSYPHLTPETANECSQAAYAYDHDCYCVLHWGYADFLPRAKYLHRPTKWLEATVWRSFPEYGADRPVAAVAGDNGPELLRNLQAALTAITSGQQPDPSLPAPVAPLRPLRQPYRPPEGGGWIATAPQTTQELNTWPH